MKKITILLTKLTPNWQVRPIILFTLLLSLLFISACSKDDPAPEDPIAIEPIEDPAIVAAANLTAFNTTVKALPGFENTEKINLDTPEEIPDSETAPAEIGNYLCTTKSYKVAPGYSEMLLLNPNEEKFYPGALIKGESITTGEYLSIAGSRKPITIKYSQFNLDGDVSRLVENPTSASVAEAINDILSAPVIGATAADLSFGIENVYSREQLSASIGANYSGASYDVSGQFNFESDKVESKIVIKFVQKYFSISMNEVTQPSDLFSETDLPDPATFGTTLPYYVSSVNYGRMVLFTATSSYSNTEMKLAFEASYDDGVFTEAGVQANAEYQNIINNSTIKAYVRGGAGDGAVQTINGVEGLKEYILTGGNYSKDSPGAPLSYTLNNISDGGIAEVVLATQYTARECNKIRSSFKITLVELDCTNVTNEGSTPQMYGYIDIATDKDHLAYLSALEARDPFDFLNFPSLNDIGLWGTYTEDTQQQATASKLIINESAIITLENISNESYIFIRGNLYEADAGGFLNADPDDDLGYNSKIIYLPELVAGATIVDPFKLKFNGDGDAADAIFTIEPLD
jgi:thiol-activated cytolysin